MAGMTIGRNSYIYDGAEVRNPKGIFIGDDVIVGHNSILDGRAVLRIENNVNLSAGVRMWTMQHDHRSPTFAATGAPVTIREYVWLAGRLIVLPGITIGQGAVVASGAVVTRDIDPYHIVGGVPAKTISERKKI